jgi:hypothetical protein
MPTNQDRVHQETKTITILQRVLATVDIIYCLSEDLSTMTAMK